jgi:hypothetical protein
MDYWTDHWLDAVTTLLASLGMAAGEREGAAVGGRDGAAGNHEAGIRPEIERPACALRHHQGSTGESMILALITASAAVLPSTVACPRNFHTPSFFCCLTTLMRNWSPGTTGRRKRA